MRTRWLRFGVMLGVSLGVVGLALGLGMTRGEAPGAGTQSTATPTTSATTATTATPATTLLSNPPTCTATTLGGTRTANALLATDCDTLLAIESMLAGTATLNWAPTRELASWEGVTVGGTPKRVTWLNLGGKQLTGVIPTQLGRLTALTRLVLYRNQLTGSIPKELENLTALTELKLAGNTLTGCVPNTLWLVATKDLARIALGLCTPPVNMPVRQTVGAGTYRIDLNLRGILPLIFTVPEGAQIKLVGGGIGGCLEDPCPGMFATLWSNSGWIWMELETGKGHYHVLEDQTSDTSRAGELSTVRTFFEQIVNSVRQERTP